MEAHLAVDGAEHLHETKGDRVLTASGTSAGDVQALHLVSTPIGCWVSFAGSTCHRSGALWEGRQRATLVDSDQYLLAPMRLQVAVLRLTTSTCFA
jgi:hypothetical protein